MNGDLMHHFFDYLQEKNYSKESLRAYKRRLSMFIGYLHDRKISAVAPGMSQVLQVYMQFLCQTLEARSVNNHISSVEHFLSYCGSPVRISRVSTTDDPAKIQGGMALTDAQSAELLHVVNTLTSDRDRSILLLAIVHGFRLRELRNMRVADVMDTGNALHIALPARGRCVQYVRIEAGVADVLRRWMRARGRSVEGALFCTRDFRQMSVDAVDHVIRSCGWRANLVLNARVLRYTCKQPWDSASFIAS